MTFEKYCGPDAIFWNTSLTWRQERPDLSHCFQRTVLLWLPCTVLLLLVAPLELVALRHLRATSGSSGFSVIPYTPLNVAKFVSVAVLFITQIASFIHAFVRASNGATIAPQHYATPSVVFFSLAVVLLLMVMGKCRGRRTSGGLWLFWLLMTVCGSVEFRTRLLATASNLTAINSHFQQDMTEFVLYVVYYAMVVSQFLLHCWADVIPEQDASADTKEVSPETASSFFSQLTFTWFDAMVWRGWRRDLTTADLYGLNHEDRSSRVVPAFFHHWHTAVARNRAKNAIRSRSAEATATVSHSVESAVRFEAKSPDRVQFVGTRSSMSPPPPPSPSSSSVRTHASILPSLARAFGGSFLFGSLLKLLYDLLQFVNPQLLSLIITFVSDSSEPAWHGVFYTVLLASVSAIMSCILNRYFLIVMRVGMQLRTALIAAVYRKALTISNTARQGTTVGEIVNMMSVDAQRFMDLTSYISLLWSAPLQIALSIYFLYQELGPSVFSGLAVMIVLMPVNGIIANFTKKLQLKQMKYKDHRVKVMNEVLNGIKVLKLYAWEPSFEKRILAIRDQELLVLKKAAVLNAITSFIWTCAPFIVSLASFATYVLSDPENNVLDSKRAFVSLALFNALRFPLSMLPMILATCVQANVSLKRLNKFLNSEDLDEFAVTVDKTETDPVVITDGCFVWDRRPAAAASHSSSSSSGTASADPPLAADAPQTVPPPEVEPEAAGREAATLHDIDVRVRRGSLVAVVGSVGAGKSSLLAAILGEMEKVSGCVNVQGSVAYVAQEAWIQNASLRDNVLFNRPWDESRYRRTVQSCALTVDFDMLPAGDATEIGEKGINLSGGQKQRVALARALYSDSAIYLLDDPLSAVDAHVGRHLFDQVIGPNGMLKDKTRILVTHSMSYLAQTDLVLVMKNGRVSEAGAYADLVAARGAFADFLLQYLNTAEQRQGLEERELDELKQQLEEQMGRGQLERKMSAGRCEQAQQSGVQSRGSLAATSDVTATVANSSDVTTTAATAAAHAAAPAAPVSTDGASTSPHKYSTTPVASSLPVNGKSPTVDGVSAELTPAATTRAAATAAAGADKSALAGKLVDAEKSETGKVKLSVYWYYLRAVGVVLSMVILFLYTVAQSFSVGSSLWLAHWTDDTSAFNNTAKRDLYLGVYAALGFCQAVGSVASSLFLALGVLSAAGAIHGRALGQLLRLPLSYFDVTPSGRTVNRFSKDVDALDTTLPMSLRSFLFCLQAVLGTFFAITYATPIFIAVLLPVLVLYYFMQMVYVATSRQLKRLESVSRSPIYSHFSETITGAATIRAFGMSEQFTRQSELLVDSNQICYYPSMIANRWLSFRLDMVGTVITSAAALLAVLARATIDQGLVGMSISYAMQVTQTLNWLVRMSSDVETNIVAVERIREYSDVTPEADWYVGDKTGGAGAAAGGGTGDINIRAVKLSDDDQSLQQKDAAQLECESGELEVVTCAGRGAPTGWPDKGRVVFDNYQTRYRPGLDLVLRGISADIAGGEKVGIVGRTGAGKSSLTMALFRVVEAAGGRICVDGVPLDQLGLHDVRRRITIIPQEPVLFSGSLRYNLDPLDHYYDDQLWRALQLSHLRQFVQQLPAALQHEISEGGANLSVGQRQLVCLARALLRKSRILVLDEATAALDLETDDIIQSTIRSEFADCTVLTIAHRLNTILDSDRVIVLSAGKIVEFAPPAELLSDTSSVFYGMAKSAGVI